ncbi:MAG: monofunctional biosynthetic peptidoglycan transglycosylase, partial [Nitrospirales bacterium]
VLLVGFLVGGVLLYWLNALPDVSALARHNPSTTALMELRRVQAKAACRPYYLRWTWQPLDRISPHLLRAVIVAEDAAFYGHEGFDWEGIQDAVKRNLESGKAKRGGSTITQQVAKNLYLTPKKSWTRKITEALITRELERKLSKRRILEIYLNVAEWGNGVFGAEAAAIHHFGKLADDLTAEEAALLAAILPAPRRHDPLEITGYVAKRQRRILSFMDR